MNLELTVKSKFAQEGLPLINTTSIHTTYFLALFVANLKLAVFLKGIRVVVGIAERLVIACYACCKFLEKASALRHLSFGTIATQRPCVRLLFWLVKSCRNPNIGPIKCRG